MSDLSDCIHNLTKRVDLPEYPHRVCTMYDGSAWLTPEPDCPFRANETVEYEGQERYVCRNGRLREDYNFENGFE